MPLTRGAGFEEELHLVHNPEWGSLVPHSEPRFLDHFTLFGTGAYCE